jgi:hypothetical protein
VLAGAGLEAVQQAAFAEEEPSTPQADALKLCRLWSPSKPQMASQAVAAAGKQ